MDDALTIVASTLDVEHAEVLELLPDGESLLLRAGLGWKAGYVGHGTLSVSNDSQEGFTLLSGEPVVVVADTRSESRFDRRGLWNDLQKPFNASTLADKIREVLDVASAA